MSIPVSIDPLGTLGEESWVEYIQPDMQSETEYINEPSFGLSFSGFSDRSYPSWRISRLTYTYPSASWWTASPTKAIVVTFEREIKITAFSTSRRYGTLGLFRIVGVDKNGVEHLLFETEQSAGGRHETIYDKPVIAIKVTGPDNQYSALLLEATYKQ